MSKKSRKAEATCLGCGKSLKAKWAACPRCRRVNMARVRKTAAPVLTKSARAVLKSATVQCGRGHWNRPGGACCTVCGDLMPGIAVPPVEWVGKSALATNFWETQYGNSPDPGLREMVRKARYGGLGGGTA